MISFRNVLIPVEFHFVFVWSLPSDRSESDPRPGLAEELEDFVSEFSHAGEHETHVELLTSHPATEICHYARDHACELIKMATHGRTEPMA